jgi:type IV pilus assembly protein PilM
MSFDFGKLSSLLKKDIGKSDSGAVIGVDVGSSSIKVVQLHLNKEVATLDTYGELQLGPYDNTEIGRSVRLRPDKLIEAFIDILREAGTTAKSISLAISYNATFTAVITIPTDDPVKADQMLTIEARKYIPVPLTDVTLDWVPISLTEDRKGTKGLIVAIHNEALSRYDAMVHGSDLPSVAREIELFSTIRTTLSQNDTTVGVIDLGAGSTKIYLVHNGVIGKSHSIQMNGVEITSLIAKTLGVDFHVAEEQKRRQGLGIITDNPALEKGFTDILSRGFREIHTIIRRFEEEEHVHIEKVILTGGGAVLRGLVTYVTDALSTSVVIADPFTKVAYPAFLEDTLKEAGPSFAVALGVALRGLK